VRLASAIHRADIWVDRLTEFVRAAGAGIVRGRGPAWQRQERDNVSCVGYQFGRGRGSCPAPRVSAWRTGIHCKRPRRAGRSHGPYGITVATAWKAWAQTRGRLTWQVNAKPQLGPPGKPGRRRRLKPTLAALSGILLLFGCGSSGSRPNHIAAIDGGHITNAEVQQNMEYVLHFSAWVDPGSITTHAGMCTGKKVSAGCLRLRRQVISRLVEQHIIQAYARQHKITLGTSDQARVDQQVARLAASDAETSSLFNGHLISPRFMREVLSSELLVQKVEAHLFARQSRAGIAYHVRKYLIPKGSRAYRQATDLATDGKPVPASAVLREEWVAPFRLTGQLKQDVQAASAGEFIGPMTQSHAYLVVELLGKGHHRYGHPARAALETRYFRDWLAAQVRKKGPQCYDSQTNPTPCPAPAH